jgi:hypothetical protein
MDTVTVQMDEAICASVSLHPASDCTVTPTARCRWIE